MKEHISLGLVAIIILSIFGACQPDIDDPPQDRLFDSLPAFKSCAELRQAFQSAQPRSYAMYESVALGSSAPMKASLQSADVSYSRTNIQVEGVDEADIIKTDGKYIYA